MTKFEALRNRLMANPEVKAAYDSLEDEYSVAAMLVEARKAAGLSQTEVAERMETTQSSVARLESGSRDASLKSLRAYAQATGRKLRISLEPVEHRPQQ